MYRPPQVRHYWDADAHDGAGGLYLAFSQARLQYGFEYDGRPLDAASAPSTTSVPNLLSAIGALSTSPVLSLGLPAGGGGAVGGCREAVAALAALAGKFHVALDLTPDTTPRALTRALTCALATGSWASIDGAQVRSRRI